MFVPVESKAFPTQLAREVAAVTSALSDYQLHPPSKGFAVFVEGEQLEIPYRAYYRESQLLKCIERLGTQSHIALCLGTRHHDGFLRERCLRQIITVEQPWVVPFVTQLVGEYVLQIMQVVEEELPNLNMQLYGEFLNANATLHETIRRRVVSYWNEYYRRLYPRWKDYAGFRVLTAFHNFAERSNPALRELGELGELGVRPYI